MAKKPPKIIMQQRKNFAAAKSKLVNTVKENYIDPVRRDPNEPKEPRAKFGSWEGKVSTFLGLAPSQNENSPELQGSSSNRTSHFQTGATEHLPENVVSLSEFKEKKNLNKGQ